MIVVSVLFLSNIRLVPLIIVQVYLVLSVLPFYFARKRQAVPVIHYCSLSCVLPSVLFCKKEAVVPVIIVVHGSLSRVVYNMLQFYFCKKEVGTPVQ
jgi:hypothetical protein